ncbi:MULTISPECIES: hypothetical protein [Gluconobacter]|uniref:hypothetical protein n=1 Tax=Gluconobacter TaxID=441 RepID=UPI0039E93AE8
MRSDLIEHVGGKPSATQKALIERAAWMTLHVTMMDRKMMEGGAPAERDARQYLAWANTLTRTMRQLGIEGTAASAPSLDAYLNGRVA